MIRRKRLFVFIAFAVILFSTILRFFHLEADFPSNFTHYGVLYTDEGWYSNAAASHVLTGDWHIDGDFNPAINLPTFPIAQLITFRLFGLSLASARITNILFYILLLPVLFFLIRFHANVNVAIISLVILSMNYCMFIYSRLAILELPMIIFVALSLLFVSLPSNNRRAVFIILSAITLFIALLTKTTALFALPVIFYIIWRKQRSIRGSLFQYLLFSLVVGMCFIAYYFSIIKTYGQDYHYFNTLNYSSRLEFDPLLILKGLARAIFYGKNIGIIFYPLALVTGLFSFIFVKSARRNVLLGISLIWIVVYLAMIGIYNYVPPRYYLPIIIPASIILAVMFDQFKASGTKSLKTIVLTIAILISLGIDSFRTIHYIKSPDYSWMKMTEDIKNRIGSNEDNPVLLGHFANSISLATQIFSINDRLGTKPLEYKIEKYRPNYYVSLGSIEAEIQHALDDYYDVTYLNQYDVYHNYYTGEPVYLYQLRQKE